MNQGNTHSGILQTGGYNDCGRCLCVQCETDSVTLGRVRVTIVAIGKQ